MSKVISMESGSVFTRASGIFVGLAADLGINSSGLETSLFPKAKVRMGGSVVEFSPA